MFSDVVVDGTPNLRMSTLPLETRQEESFATHSQERIMGLLGAMIPLKDKVRMIVISFILSGCKINKVWCRMVLISVKHLDTEFIP